MIRQPSFGAGRAALFLSLSSPLLGIWPGEERSMFRHALESAQAALEAGNPDGARGFLQRALERDRRSIEAWELRARWARAVGDQDELVWSLHKRYDLSVAQKRPRAETEALREELFEADPFAEDLLGMRQLFMRKLVKIAERYEKEERPHGAIEAWKKVQSLDPESAAAQEAIQRIASTPDPSLAGEAKPKDLFADVSQEWIREHDEEHAQWNGAAELKRENYVTRTNAGYEVLVRSAEAMEQMNAFYRQFFRYGTEEDGKNVSRIGLNIFRTRDEYLKLGIGPPVEWSGGHFTGSHVETFVGEGGFEQMVGTLFHEAAHQFVSLATNASGWLNEGLASFFEGTRILPNGTVIMNLPANHRLFPLAERMEKGWMRSHDDGIDASDAKRTPETAPTFGIVLENKYEWGPPWYAPTWGVVYFLYNYQDPADGRFIYREAFGDFIDSSGGRVGSGAVKNFEEVVLAAPKPPIRGFERPAGSRDVPLPETVQQLDGVWKDWILNLRGEQRGSVELERPYREWGRAAVLDKDWVTAAEHFEKGLVEQPDDIELLTEYADLLREHFGNADRAAKLVMEALYWLEKSDERDEKRVKELERLLDKLDPQRDTFTEVMDEMAAAVRGLVQRYDSAGLQLMLMDVAWRFGRDLELADLFELYEAALRKSGKSLEIWSLAYDEQSLAGWNAPADGVWRAAGPYVESSFGEFDEDLFDYRPLTVDTVVGGDFSMEAEIQAGKGEVNFCGFLFGGKSDTTFHGLLYFPGKTVAEGGAESAFVDLMSSYGSAPRTWRHVPVPPLPASAAGEERSVAGVPWRSMRLDVSGRHAEITFDGELLATHEFASVDVVRGGFGLVTGPGRARFRNIRYLARDPADPASRIQREIRLEELRSQEGAPVGGSYQGQVPPFPLVGRWAQGERSSWTEVGAVPQLLVFFSIQQNDLVPIDEWLSELAREGASYGLQVVAVASPNDDSAIESYLAAHPMPGSVAVDRREGIGIGDTFELYDIRRFNLPRLILLDVDGRVSWEGDPGFEIGAPYDASLGSFLDDPLEELVEKRRLREVAGWIERWESVALPALAEGDLRTALPLLLESRDFPSGFYEAVDSAQARLGAVQSSIRALAVTAESLAREEAEPALAVLIEWAPLFEVTLDRKLERDLRSHTAGERAKDWAECLRELERFAKKRNEALDKAAALAQEVAGHAGLFPRELALELEQAAAAGDADRLLQLAEGAGERPRQWLVKEYFGW